MAANKLLEEFQRLALTLDGTAQEVSRTMTTLTDVIENTRVGMSDRNAKLRGATQAFMRDIAKAAEPADPKREIDMRLRDLADNMRTQIRLLNFQNWISANRG